jgi:hypothetical protein
MQGQMEICDLERCDFLECKIEEYADEEAYSEDISSDSSRESGVVVSFKKKDGALVHEYSPFFLKGEPLQEWTIKHIREKTILPKFADRLEYLGASYWYIKFYQCVPVFRDRDWFDMAKVKLAEFYEKWQHYKSLGEDGIRQLQTFKPKKSEYGDKSITEYTAVVIEEKEEVVLSVPKLNKFAFTSTKMIASSEPKETESEDEHCEKIVFKIKKFGFSKL